MKKYFYIFCFIVLGVILQQIVHSVVEVWYIKLLVKDFNKYSLGLSWDVWFFIHNIYGPTLFIAGVLFGYWQGNYWWPRLYDKDGKVKYPKPWRI